MGVRISQLAHVPNTSDGTTRVPVIQMVTGVFKTLYMTAAEIAALAGTTPVATLTGSVAGSAYVYQMAGATHYKRWVIVLVGWNDAGQSYTWGTAFDTFANILQNMSPPVSSVSTTSITLPATGGVVNGIVEVAGD